MKRNKISNITRKELIKCPEKYLRIPINDQYDNEMFSIILKYIDKNSQYIGREHEFGNAFVRIKARTNELLGITVGTPLYARTSKREIRSILENFYKGKIRNRELFFTYKISYIFRAIIDIINEISEENPLPKELSSKDSTYAIFYERHISEYNAVYKELTEKAKGNKGYEFKLELNNDFNAENNIFKTKIVRR